MGWFLGLTAEREALTGGLRRVYEVDAEYRIVEF
jgi:hypothetical protein